MRRLSLTFLGCPLLCSFAAAQMSTAVAAKAIADLPGLPKNPPIFSQMTVIEQARLDYEDSLNLKGRVASVERLNEQQPAQNPNPFHAKLTLQFDESGRLVKRTNEASMDTSTETLVWENGKLRKQEVLHHGNNGRFADSIAWCRWSYDKGGRVSEALAGKDKEAPINDYRNFKYDGRGRLLEYELNAQSITQISYQGNRIILSAFQEYPYRKVFEQVQVIDDKGLVTDLKVSDMSGGELKPWYHVTFKYDDKGRVIEQQTDPFKLGSGDDYSPVPGKLTVEYDDKKQSGEQKFYDPDGKLVLHTNFEYDRDGVLTKLHLVDSSGKERIGGETFVDAQYKTSTRPGSVEWEVIYDDHGNWIERRRWFTPADGSPKIMTRLVRQKITYR
jgi:antitoxin component YwqK of YwqJK toxin-antitoxin module